MSEAPLTRDQIKAAYSKLAAEVGDLYFTLDNARAHVTALEARMSAMRGQRDALQKAYESATETSTDAATPADPV